MAIRNNYNRWGNFNNEALYDKYKRSQSPVVASAPSQEQQQQGGDEWNQLGKNIGKTWRESLAKRNDAMYNGNIVGGTGTDAQNYANMQNAMASNDLGLQNTAYGTTDWNTALANNPSAISAGEPVALGSDIGTQAGLEAMANAGTNVGADVLANAGANGMAGLGASSAGAGLTGAATGEAIGAGTAAATEGATAGATAGAGAGLASVLGPLAGAYGLYELGKHFDWWG